MNIDCAIRDGVKVEKYFHLSTLLYMVISFFCIFGQMQYGKYISKTVVSVAIVFWLLLCLLENPKAFKIAISTSSSCLILLSIFIRFLFLLLSPEGVVGSIEFVFLRLSMYVPMFAFLYYRNAVDNIVFKRIVYVSVLMWILCALVILTFIDFNLTTARLISAGKMSRGFFGSLLDIVIGTACVILGVYGARKRTTLKRNQKKIMRFFWCTMVLYVLISYYTQSFISMFVGFFGLLWETIIANKNRSTFKRAALFSIIVFTMIILLLCRENIGMWAVEVAPVFKGSIFETKMIEIGKTLISSSSVGDLNVRVQHFTTSFLSFLNSPLWGTTISNGYSVEMSVVGMHSGIDVLARYGVLGGLPLLIGEYKYLTACKKYTEGYFTNAIIIVSVMYFLLSGWEHVEGLFALLFLTPGLSLILSRESKIELMRGGLRLLKYYK